MLLLNFKPLSLWVGVEAVVCNWIYSRPISFGSEDSVFLSVFLLLGRISLNVLSEVWRWIEITSVQHHRSVLAQYIPRLQNGPVLQKQSQTKHTGTRIKHTDTNGWGDLPASTLNHTNNRVKNLNSGVYTSNMAIHAKIRVPKRMRQLCEPQRLWSQHKLLFGVPFYF